ncbi:MAG: hypothetical protein EB078_06175 [Proteobacteria bacterium]|nr:hypothetical protein [Pseudomonadota bacterium]NDC23779.1 hypothetical protein [Pseudomonadota bacterium]NDD04472.1 hypothetical protein [Pseudomonadota bacterium]NDG26252.1 hypothetical protein [Pseudomonadota bacterium]
MVRFVSYLGFLVLSMSVIGHASTHVYSVEEFIHVKFVGTDASTLLRSLNLPLEQGSSGPGKVFQTTDRSVELYCFKRHYNVEPYACEVQFDLRGFSNTTVIKNHRKGLEVKIVESESNNRLYQALEVEGSLENGNAPKLFQTQDQKFRLDCSQNKECSFLIDLN